MIIYWELSIQFEVQESINIRNMQLGSITVEMSTAVKTTRMYKVIWEKLQSERESSTQIFTDQHTGLFTRQTEKLNQARQIKK